MCVRDVPVRSRSGNALVLGGGLGLPVNEGEQRQAHEDVRYPHDPADGLCVPVCAGLCACL